MEPARRRRTRSPSPTYKLDDEDDTYEPYIPVAQRRQEKLAKLSSLGFNSTKKVAKRLQEEQPEREDSQQEEEVKKEKTRKERLLLLEAQEVQKKKATEGLEICYNCPDIFLNCIDRCYKNCWRKSQRARWWNTGRYQEQEKAGFRHGVGQRHPIYWTIKDKVCSLTRPQCSFVTIYYLF